MPSVTRPAKRDPGQRGAVVGQVAGAVERLLAGGQSYTTLGVQRIADEAGIARSTFYLHFPDKSALLMRLAEAATEDLFAAAEAWLEDGFADVASLEETLRAVIAQQRAHRDLLAALAEVAGYDPDVAAFWRDRMGQFIDVLRRRIEHGQQEGTVAPALDPATAAAWIAWGTERLVAQHVATAPESADPRLARGIAIATWTALGRSGPLRRARDGGR